MSAATMVKSAEVEVTDVATITEDEAYALFDEMAGSPEGLVGVEAIRSIANRYSGIPRMRRFLENWLFTEREMTPRGVTPEVMCQVAPYPEDRRRIVKTMRTRLRTSL